MKGFSDDNYQLFVHSMVVARSLFEMNRLVFPVFKIVHRLCVANCLEHGVQELDTEMLDDRWREAWILSPLEKCSTRRLLCLRTRALVVTGLLRGNSKMILYRTSLTRMFIIVSRFRGCYDLYRSLFLYNLSEFGHLSSHESHLCVSLLETLSQMLNGELF